MEEYRIQYLTTFGAFNADAFVVKAQSAPEACRIWCSAQSTSKKYWFLRVTCPDNKVLEVKCTQSWDVVEHYTGAC